MHDQQVDFDLVRDDHLQAMGYQVLRFNNEEVCKKLSAVLENVVRVLSQTKHRVDVEKKIATVWAVTS